MVHGLTAPIVTRRIRYVIQRPTPLFAKTRNLEKSVKKASSSVLVKSFRFAMITHGLQTPIARPSSIKNVRPMAMVASLASTKRPSPARPKAKNSAPATCFRSAKMATGKTIPTAPTIRMAKSSAVMTMERRHVSRLPVATIRLTAISAAKPIPRPTVKSATTVRGKPQKPARATHRSALPTIPMAQNVSCAKTTRIKIVPLKL